MLGVVSMKATHQIFADEWIRCRNATEAYLAAFHLCTNRKTAGTEGHKLLKKPEINEYIQEKLAELSRNAGLSVQRVLEEEARLSLSDIRQIFKGGTPIPPEDLPEDIARAIKGVKQTTRNVFHTDGSAEIITTYDYVFWDKGASLKRVEKYLGMLTEKVDITTGGQEINTPEETLRRLAFMLRNKEESSQGG